MDINQLRYFVEICKQGNMSKAAAALFISPQGISAAIRRLEDELGADLFYRTNNGLELTRLGKAVKLEADGIIAHIDRIYELSSLESSGKAGITVAISTGRFMKMPVALQKMLLTPPDEFSVTISNNYSTVCMDMVLKEEATFGFVYGQCNTHKFNVTKIEDVRQVFVVSKKNPLAEMESIKLKDLDGKPLLMPDLNTIPGMQIANAFAEQDLTLNLAYVCMTPHQAIDIAAKNDAIIARTLYTDLMEEDYSKVSVLKIDDFELLTPFSLITKKGKKLSVHEQLFEHLMLDCFR